MAQDDDWDRETAWWDEADAERWRQKQFQRQMERCRSAWGTGVSLAVAEAVAWCRIYGYPPPEWLDIAVLIAIGRPQSKEDAKRYHDDLIDFTRWSAVKELREQAVELCEHALRRRPGERTEMELLLIGGWRPSAAAGEQISLDVCFDAVSKALKGTAAQGGSSAVKQSYYRVEHAIEAGEGAKYFLTRQP
jgi:hypothetical protein